MVRSGRRSLWNFIVEVDLYPLLLPRPRSAKFQDALEVVREPIGRCNVVLLICYWLRLDSSELARPCHCLGR
jgi:hypothetical protein